MEKPEFIVFGRPTLGEEEINEVDAVLRSGWLGTGPRVNALQQAFATFKGVPSSRVCALNSCTAALHLSLIAAGIGPGDEVITTPLTFCATVNAIIHVGATPVLADIDPQSLNLDPPSVASKISDRTRAIIPVHFAGRPCEMDSINELAAQGDCWVIEDCAHALEATYRGQPTGTLGDIGAFSLYATKNVTAGEGGLVIAADDAMAERIGRLSLHGLSRDAWQRYTTQGFKHYQVLECGFKYNMMDLQAAIAIHQLGRVWQAQQRRSEIWQQYMQAFSSLPLELPAETPSHMTHAHHLFTIQVDPQRCGFNRDEVAQRLTAKDIGVGVHYLPVNEHLFYREKFGWRGEDTPCSSLVGQQILSLPLYPGMDEAMVSRVVTAMVEIFGN